ncbi:MAG: TetR/AcrR family transcriptional regulator [Anaerolineae bacterium]|nr:TetR/AcrR family transcriptional regulator [Anaerolineae bacterium]
MSKNEARLDPRVKRTRQFLRTALIELIPEKGYNAITIQDITERATLNRATFYLHYRDKDDLLLNGFVEIWDELTSQNPTPGLKEGSLETEGIRLSVLADFRHLADHAAFYRVMLGENGVAEFIHRMQDHVYHTTIQRFRAVVEKPPASAVPPELTLHFIATSYVGVMQWWLAQDMPYPPEEIASMLVTLYTTSPFQALGIAVK